MKYLSTDNGISFKDSTVNKILDNDIQISEEIYNKFFELQCQGKQFKVKNINGTTFEEIFEEYTSEPVTIGKTELEILKETVDMLVMSML